MAAATASATATGNLSSKAKTDNLSKASYEPGNTKLKIKSELIPNTKFDKNTEGVGMVFTHMHTHVCTHTHARTHARTHSLTHALGCIHTHTHTQHACIYTVQLG